jgi:DNA-directed RNA polymerase specialized sigma24 family protein
MRPSQDDSQIYQPEDRVAEAEKVSVLLNSVFGDDERAKDVFVLRQVDGFGPSEIQARLGISGQDYETINRRILRKISQFLKN